MRICSAFRIGLATAALCAAAPALAFDPTLPDTDEPAEAFRHGYNAYRLGDFAEAIDALGYAAERGYTQALWLLGQMYANGDGVEANPERAFDIFAEIVNAHAGDRRITPDAPFVANAFVALGDFYRKGAVNGAVDAEMALSLYMHAATYLDDPQAQYNLAEMFYFGEAGPRNAAEAARWAQIAARRGHADAQALFGYLLFQGDGVSRQPLVGLAYLTLAYIRSAGRDPDIRRMHEEALAVATETQRRTAQELADNWLTEVPAAAAAPPADAPPAAAAAPAAEPR